MKVYRGGRAGSRHPFIVAPGADANGLQDDEFFTVIPIAGANGAKPRLVRSPRNITVLFVNGEADVDEKLGKYLVKKGHAKLRPQRMQPAAPDTHVFQEFKEKQRARTAPIAVGRPLEEVLGQTPVFEP
jgi:hypothetical protein